MGRYVQAQVPTLRRGTTWVAASPDRTMWIEGNVTSLNNYEYRTALNQHS